MTIYAGKEGKKKNWQPWDCIRIIMENVGPGESHGCPFRCSIYVSLSMVLHLDYHGECGTRGEPWLSLQVLYLYIYISLWDCIRIIVENVGPGENYGCPFRCSVFIPIPMGLH